MNENLKLKGVFSLTVYEEGKDPVTYIKDNLIVDLGRNSVVAMLANDATDKYITTIAAGTNGVSPTGADTAITGAWTKAIASHSYPQTGKVSFSWSMELFENNGMNIQEFGLLAQDGSLFARVNYSPIAKTNLIRLVGVWSFNN